MKFDLKRDWKFWTVLIVAIIAVLAIAFYKIELTNLTSVVGYNLTENKEKYDQEYEAKQIGDEVGQIFLAKYNNLNKIYVQFSKLSVRDHYWATGGTATLGIKDMEGNIIYEKNIDRNELSSNTDYMFEFPTIKQSANQHYYMFFICDGLEEGNEFYKISYSNENLYENGDMYINGEKQTGDILFQEMYYSVDILKILVMYILMIILILSLISILIYYDKKIDIKKLFWYVIPVLFIAFLILMPTFKNHDEPFHWFRIYDIAQGNYLTQVIEEKPVGIVKKEVLDITNIKPEGINYKYIIEKIKENVQSGNSTAVSLDTTAIYNPIQYIPQTIRTTNS